MSATTRVSLFVLGLAVIGSPLQAQGRRVRPSEYVVVTKDYDGDKKADFALRMKDGHWLIDYAKNGLGAWDTKVQEKSPGGAVGAKPCPEDYDGDGKADIAIFLRSNELCIDYAKNGFGKWDVIRSYSLPKIKNSKSTPPNNLANTPPALKPSNRAKTARSARSARSTRAGRSARTARPGRRTPGTRREAKRPARKANQAAGNFVGRDIVLIVNGLNHDVRLVIVNKPVTGGRRVVNGRQQNVTIRVAKSQKVTLTVNGLGNRVEVPKALTQNVTSKVNGNGNSVRYTK